jgi:hypothetical protein
MHPLDWLILLGTLGFIVDYGVLNFRNNNEPVAIFTASVKTAERNNPRK